MRSVAIVLTTACPLRCSYCLMQREQPRTMEWTVLARVLDTLVTPVPGEVEVLFTGGEPLVAFPLIRRAVAHVEGATARAAQVHWAIVTNGLRLTPEILSFLDAHGFLLNLSFDGVAAAQDARGRGTFPVLDRLLASTRRNHPHLFATHLRVSMTVSPTAVASLPSSVRYMLDAGVSTVGINPAVGPVSWQKERLGELVARLDETCDAVLQHRARTGDVPVELFRPRATAGATRNGQLCGAPDGYHLTIDADGRAWGCILATPSYHRRGVTPALGSAVEAIGVGPVDDPGFVDRLEAMAPAARATGAFHDRHLRYSSYGRCADCRFLADCHPCPLASTGDTACTDVRRVPDFVCAFNQAALAARERFLAAP